MTSKKARVWPEVRARVHHLGALVPLVLGIWGAAYSRSLGLGEPESPQPGFWPFITSCVVVLASVVLLFRDRGADYEAVSSPAGIRQVAYAVASITVFIMLFEMLGFIIPALLTFAFWIRFLGGEGWRISIVLSVLCTVGFYAVFVHALGVPFPPDLVEVVLGVG
ncbi:putative tricarboxylic transport membrane protein [Lipingzhangella halophila]|uniref:Putative tricarboxylic transport membrane protein n=1 Tax=Lipingzhangella halophila TaxID=1783352 RepID=A0A7W7W2L1_9ACTN|nr:tripartite tricarboxylate transporter TctB family protein [Lipingzhangella halophila]MBB4930899.1 putative tricarboxylic transport membrane protein [Lipingzhangella halophila]